MRAQVSLTPTEGKKLISKAVAGMDEVKKALRAGLVVIHPSSTTSFLVEELVGLAPTTDVWVCGVIVPKGTCSELGTTISHLRARVQGRPMPDNPVAPAEFEYSWVIKDGQLNSGTPLKALLDQMGPSDVYVKSPNALDPQGKVGVLIGNPEEGGTIARVMAAQKNKGFPVIFATGLEKLIPVSVAESAAEALRNEYSYSMGVPCNLYPCDGTVVTEPRAVEILCGAKAVPIAAGGLAGGEGSITMVIKGESDQVQRAIEVIEACKGANLRVPRLPQCNSCQSRNCSLARANKGWTRNA